MKINKQLLLAFAVAIAGLQVAPTKGMDHQGSSSSNNDSKQEQNSDNQQRPLGDFEIIESTEPTNSYTPTTSRLLSNSAITTGLSALTFIATNGSGLSTTVATIASVTGGALFAAGSWFMKKQISREVFFAGLQHAQTSEEATRLYDSLSPEHQQEETILYNYQATIQRFIQEYQNDLQAFNALCDQHQQELQKYSSPQAQYQYYRSDKHKKFTQEFTALQEKLRKKQ